MPRSEIKARDAYFCNLKLLLILLVIYGHMIEPWINTNTALNWQYRAIYAVHMPLFIFLSGYFASKSAISCMRRALHTFLLYSLCQLLAMAILRMGGKGQSFLLPWWVLWYLLGLSFWQFIAAACTAIKCRNFTIILFFISLAFSLAAGFFPVIGRAYSLSRSLVFLPYFLLGMLLPVGRIPAGGTRRYLPGVALLAIGVTFVWFMKIKLHLPASFFYQATGYGRLGWKGAYGRALSFLAALSLGTGILFAMPRRRFFFSAFGGNTILLYLLHAPCVLALRTVLQADPFSLSPIFPFLFLPLSLWLLMLLAVLARYRLPLYRIYSSHTEKEVRRNYLQMAEKKV